MKVDEETGIAPVARDGEPNVEDIEARREKRNGNGGGSAAARGEQAQLDGTDADVPIDEADDGQMFVWEQGRRVTLGTLVARGTPVEHAFVFGGKRVKGRGSLMGFDEDVMLITRGRVSKTSVVPTRDDDERVTRVTIETHIAVKVPIPAASEEAIELMRSLIAKHDADAKAERAG